MNANDKAKLVWRSRRGMLELDLIFQKFLQKHFDRLTNTQHVLFERLLLEEDPDLYAWLMGYASPIDEELKAIVSIIRYSDNT